MSDQPSSSDDVSPLNSSNFSLHSTRLECFRFRGTIIIFSMFIVTDFLLLSCLMLFCYLGFHHRRQRRSKPSMSHSDHFTFQSLAMQLIEFLGFILFFYGGYTYHTLILVFGVGLIAATSTGQALFHVCTCVERYLAVVHPITYLGLRQSTRVRIRNITIGCVCMLSFEWIAVYYLDLDASFILYLIILICSLAVVSFCSISVLCALKRPGPGKGGGGKEQVDQSKLRAFRTVMVITGALLLRFVGTILCSTTYNLRVLSPVENCVMPMYTVWFSVPSGLMILLLYLHRAGKLQCCKRNTEARR